MLISNIPVNIVRKNIKNMHLGVYPPKGKVRISVPVNISDETIRLFIISKLSWIKQNQRKFMDQERTTPREFKERESHYFQGQRYLLRIKQTKGAGRIELTNKTYMDMYVRENATLQTKEQLKNE